MLSTGDVQGCLRKLETLLRLIKYPGNVDYNSLSRGDSSAFLPIVNFTLTSFSPPFAEQLLAAGLELTGKTDLRFTDTFYKVLRDVFSYKPVLTKQQFLQWGFSQRKISIICDIINLVLQKHNQLKKPSVRSQPPNKGSRGQVQPPRTEALIVSDRLVVVNHTECHSTINPKSPFIEILSPSSPGNKVTGSAGDVGEKEEEEEEEEEEKDHLHSAEVDGRLSALENQLQDLLSALDKFKVLEKRLEDLERRPLSGELGARTLCPPLSSSSTMTDSSKEDLKERLERITNMLKSTTSLLKNTESTSTP